MNNAAIAHQAIMKSIGGMREEFYDGENYFLLLNTKCEIITFNQPAADFFNQFENAPGLQPTKAIFECIQPAHVGWMKELLEGAGKGETLKHEILVEENSEKSFWIRVTLSPAFNSNNELMGFACVGWNVHKEKTQEEKLKAQKSILKEIAKIYSHDIRQPLTNILAIINLIKYEDLNMTKTYLGYLETASNELDSIIRNVVTDSNQAATI